VDADRAAHELLGRSWGELDASAAELIAAGRAAVARWAWIRHDETLWETPLPMAGDEAPMRVLRSEPEPQDRHKAVSLGYDAADRVIAARYHYDHWEGRDGGYQLGVPHVDAVTIDGVLLRFGHRRHGVEFHAVELGSITFADRDPDGRLLESRQWWSRDGSSTARRTTYEWDGARLRRAVHTEFEGALDHGELRNTTCLDYDHDDEGLLRVRFRVEFDRYFPELDSGVLWYRSSPKAEREARRLVRQELPRRIQAWAARVAPDEPVYGLGIVHSIDSPELPPALGLGTARELREWRRQHADRATFRAYAWNPAEFQRFEPVPAELTDDPALVDAYAVLNQAWQSSANEREPRATLLRCAKELLAIDWRNVLEGAADFVVFVVADEQSDDLSRRLRATIPADVLRRVEAS